MSLNTDVPLTAPAMPLPWWRQLYIQVLIAIVIGIALGHFYPDIGQQLKPLADGFIKLVKMIIAPVIFLTVVLGIAKMGDIKKVGKIGLKSIIYFEVLTTIALILGLFVANVFAPGAGMHIDAAQLDQASVAQYSQAAKDQSASAFLLNIIPASFLGALAQGELLQVLLIAVLFGVALTQLGEVGHKVTEASEHLCAAFFKIVAMIMKLAPIGALGAMAFTIGKFGIGSLVQLLSLIAAVYLTCAFFVATVLWAVARWSGFSLWQFLRYIRSELLLVLGTSSSESALPRLLKRLEELGCDRSVVGLVVPTGYSFNLDGTCIYLTLSAVFIAQALDIPLSMTEQLTLLAVLLLTSKGAAGVTGSGFIVLAATLAALGGKVPVAGVALILGVDRFLSEARALTNFIGNAVAAMFIAKWEGLRDDDQMHKALAKGAPLDQD
jgi:aerobic C4-dicarboxylate transport protein